MIGPTTWNILHFEYGIESRSTFHLATVFEIASFIPNDPYSALSLPILLLSLYGIYKTKDRYILAIMILALIPAIILQRLLIYFLFPFSLSCARGFDFIKTKWAALVLVLMLPFAVSTALWMSTLGPDKCFISLMPDSGDSSETVLCNWQVGHWVESLSNKKVFMDGTAEYVPDVDRRYGDFITIFTSENSTLVRQIIDANNIDYILLLSYDDYYFGSKGLEINVDKYGFTVLKQEWCGTLFRT